MRTTFHVHHRDGELTVPDIVSLFDHLDGPQERHIIDLTVPGRTTDCIHNLDPIWMETGQIVPPRRNPWRATRGHRVSRHLSRGTRDFQCHFLCNLNVPTEEIPESELVPHHLTFAIPNPSTDVTEESELMCSFIQIPNHSFTDKHFAAEA